MMACASGVWRAISSSVISSDIPLMLRKNRRLARPIPSKPHPGPGRLLARTFRTITNYPGVPRLPIFLTA